MAEREERFLMRQRGAGARDVDDFSLNIGASSSERADTPDDASSQGIPATKVPLVDNAEREQRFLMRQRGAGARNVDVTLNIDAPAGSSPARSESTARSVVSFNPIEQANSQNATPTTQRSRLRQSSIAPVAQMTARDQDGTPTKRRRLSPEPGVDFEKSAAPFFDDNAEVDSQLESVEPELEQPGVSSPQASSVGSGSTKRRKKKKSVLLKSKKRKTKSSGGTRSSSVVEGDVETPASAPASARQPLKPTPNQMLKTNTPVTMDDSVENIDPQLAAPDSAHGAGLSKVYDIFNRSARAAVSAPVPAVQRILQQHGVANKENRLANTTTKPKVPARPANPARTTTDSKASSNKTKRKRKRNSTDDKNSQVVVTVQRVARISRLDFITEEDDELVAEQLSAFRQKRSPNAIDVLAQICREIVAKRLQALNRDVRGEQEQNSAEQKRQREAVRQFGDELDSRLLMMTTALDYNMSLTSRLRTATRQKAEARTQLLELRAQRDAIELQQDAVRTKNEEENKSSNERFELNTLLSDIKLAVQRGREVTDGSVDSGSSEGDETRRESLAMRLQRIGETVSSAYGRVGLLDKVKEFNRMLERMLESRGS